MERVYNFSAGPSMLPLPVLEKVQKEMLNYGGSGMSVMEMSHRSKWFDDIIKAAEATLRELMHIPDNYKVLFLQGGGSTQFAMVPLNLFQKGECDLVNTGQWSKKAMQEAQRYGKVNLVASSEDKTYNYIPTLDKATFNPNADYFYICYNNTIYGTRWTELPETGNVPLVADLSSMIMSEEIDITKFGLCFAGAYLVMLWIFVQQCLTIRHMLTRTLFTTLHLALQSMLQVLYLTGLRKWVALLQSRRLTKKRLVSFTTSLITQ